MEKYKVDILMEYNDLNIIKVFKFRHNMILELVRSNTYWSQCANIITFGTSSQSLIIFIVFFKINLQISIKGND